MLFRRNLSKFLPWPTPSNLKQSTQLHAQMVVTGALLSPLASTHLLIFLSDPKTGDFSNALNLFDQMPSPSTFSWNTIIRACSLNQTPKQSIHFYHQMRRNGATPDLYTFRFLFKSCALSSSVLEGQAAHAMFIRLFPESDAHAANSLMHMYLEFRWFDAARGVFRQIGRRDVVSWTTIVGGLAKVGSIDEAKELFDEMPVRNVVSWTSMIAGYAKLGRAPEAVEFFKMMLSDNIVLDTVALVAVLAACAQLQDLELGKWVHQFAEKEGINISENLVVALIDMYAKCGDIATALEFFESTGRKILPAWNAIIDGYCKLGEVDIARSLFDRMENRDLITFNSMITGYIQSSRLKEALLLFAKLRTSGLRPDKFTVVGLLTACSSLGALGQGKALHAYIEVSTIESDVFIGTALLDMYAKCGKIDQSMLILNKMDAKDVLTWTAIISGLAVNGMGKVALEYFSLMRKEGIRPNAVAYIAVLSACSHSGLIDDGRMHFEEMTDMYNIVPEIEHYGCMVDLLGRGGDLKEAMELIRSMPMEPNAVIWGSLLSSCRVYKDAELAERVAKNLLALEPHEDAAYVQLYNVYMDVGRWEDASKIRRQMEEMGIRKTAGYSSIAIGGQVHKFIAGDQSHLELAGIREMMSEMAKKLRSAGYLPITSQVSVDLNEEEKEQSLFAHSEKMAIAFGIMRLGPSMPIHVIKNLRVCEDCHSAIKLIAKIWSRDIVVRDRSRFHHFRDGRCSCNDFW